MEKIKIKDKIFEVYLSENQIKNRVKELANKINQDFTNDDVLFLGILNGSFVFAADFIRHININHHIEFVKFSSYMGTTSTGDVKQLFGLSKNPINKTVIILEDIIDTGITLEAIISYLQTLKPAKIIICSLLLKPDMLKADLKPDYIGFSIPNRFVVGYGLDFDGEGRNLKEIYAAVN